MVSFAYSTRPSVRDRKKLDQIEDWNEALVRHQSKGKNYDDVMNPDIRIASMPNTEDVAWLYREFEMRIDSLVKPLVLKLWKLRLDKQSDTQLLKYEAGGHYRPHLDTGIIGKTIVSRHLLFNEFEGGRPCFPPLDYAVALPRLPFFSIDYLHEVAGTAGEKVRFVLDGRAREGSKLQFRTNGSR